MHRHTLALLLFFAALALVSITIACGGNASSPTAATTPPASGGTTTPPPTTPPATTPPSGGGGTPTPTPSTTQGADFVYVASSDGIYGTSINVQQKSMKQIAGSPFAAPNLLNVAHAGTLVFAVSSDSVSASTSTLNIFRADATTGALTPVKTIPQPTGSEIPNMVFTDPSQQHLYISSLSDGEKVYGFTVDQSSGNLAPIPGSPFATNDAIARGPMYDAKFTSDGRLLFGLECPYEGGRFCSIFLVHMQADPSTGVLTRPANNTTRDADYTAFDISGANVITTGRGNELFVYSFDSSGTTAKTYSSSSANTAQDLCAVAAQPSANRVYIGSYNGTTGQPGSITAYSLSSGQLALINGTTISTGDPGAASCSLAFTPSGFLTWPTNSGLEGYVTNSDGTLSPLAASPSPSKGRPQTSIHSDTGQ